MALQNTQKGAGEIAKLLEGKRRLWMIGIGGVHMSALALWAKGQGFEVGGSDIGEPPVLERLRAAGIHVQTGADARGMAGYEAVVYTLAIPAGHPEYALAVREGLPLFSRADFLGFVMHAYQRRIGIAGAHGKSTVTAMVSEVLLAAGHDPTVFCGASIASLGGGFRQGRGEEIVFEACEYERSFLCFSPTLAVVLNCEHDHVDCFPTPQQMCEAFAAFAALPGEGGVVLAPVTGAWIEDVTKSTRARVYRFGLEAGDFCARAVHLEGGFVRCEIEAFGRSCGELRLSVPGEHNLQNALAAFGSCFLCGVEVNRILPALSAFGGVCRRMEYRGRLCGARVFDDYAHHPSEIAATLRTLRATCGQGRLFAVFQSHTYSRTAAFLDGIAGALRLADRVLIAPIFAARESDTKGMSGERIALAVGGVATAHQGLGEIAQALLRELTPQDTVAVMGAGDVDGIFAEFSEKDFTSR